LTIPVPVSRHGFYREVSVVVVASILIEMEEVK